MEQQPQSLMGFIPGPAQISYANPSYAPTMATGAQDLIGTVPFSAHSLTGAAPYPPSSNNFPYQHQYHQQQQQQQQQPQLQSFWANQMHKLEQTTDFKNHSLPLARIKKIMKADEDVRMISAEAPVIFAEACEMFILELTLRSWIHAEENKRRTLQKNGVAAAINRTDIFDFLVDIVPREETKDDGLGIQWGSTTMADPVPYYYMPSQPHVGDAGMIAGQHVDQSAAAATSMYPAAPPQPHPMGFVSSGVLRRSPEVDFDPDDLESGKDLSNDF